jgi:hypothetical protein
MDDEALNADGIDRFQLIDEIERWVEFQIAKAPASIRSAWFRESLRLLAQASDAYRLGHASDASAHMRRFNCQLNEGNKASRRHPSFVASSDGTVRDVRK